MRSGLRRAARHEAAGRHPAGPLFFIRSGSPSMLFSAGASFGKGGLASASSIDSPPSPSPAPAVRLRRAPGFPLSWIRYRGHPRRREGQPRGPAAEPARRHRAASGAGGDRQPLGILPDSRRRHRAAEGALPRQRRVRIVQ